MVTQKIVFFIPDFNGGGAERALLNLLSYWPPALRELWQPVLVVRTTTGALQGEVPVWLMVHSLNLPRSGIRSSVLTVYKLGHFLRQYQPKAVVAFLSLPSVILASKLAAIDCKIIASTQSPPVSTAMDKARSLYLRWEVAQWFNRYMHRQVDLFLPISPGIADQLVDQFGVNPDCIKIVPNTVGLQTITQLKNSPFDGGGFVQENKVPLIITVCRLSPEKRVDVLLQAVALLRDRVDFCLLILGDGPQRQALQDLARQLGVHQKVMFLGFQKNPWQYMARATVFVLTSEYEGFGNVIIEAMACGVPVIATKAPFGPQYIIAEPEQQGILVPTNNPEAVAQALERVLKDEGVRTRLIAGGQKRAADFEIAKVFKLFWDAMQTILDKN